MRPKSPKPTERAPSALDSQKRALMERESQLNEEIERRQKLIAEAPRLAEQAARRRREEFIQRKSRSEARFGQSMALSDPRYGFEAQTAAAPRSLRKHRNQGMYTFFLLCGVLVLVAGYVYLRLTHGL